MNGRQTILHPTLRILLVLFAVQTALSEDDADLPNMKIPSYPLDYTDYIIIGVTCAAACGLTALAVTLFMKSRHE